MRLILRGMVGGDCRGLTWDSEGSLGGSPNGFTLFSSSSPLIPVSAPYLPFPPHPCPPHPALPRAGISTMDRASGGPWEGRDGAGFREGRGGVRAGWWGVEVATPS